MLREPCKRLAEGDVQEVDKSNHKVQHKEAKDDVAYYGENHNKQL